MTKKIYAVILSLLLLLASGGTSLADAKSDGFIVISNDANGVKSMSASEVSRLFLKKKKRWDNGLTVVPVDQSRKSEVRESFSKRVHHKSLSAINSYWQGVIFSGRGVPPVELPSDRDVLAYVQNTPGAIGYVSTGTSTAGVTVIAIH